MSERDDYDSISRALLPLQIEACYGYAVHLHTRAEKVAWLRAAVLAEAGAPASQTLGQC